MPEKIALEDFCEDIVGKAMRGLGISDDVLAESAQVTPQAVQALRRGKGEEAVVRAVAPCLNLNPDKLVESFHGSWYPQVPPLEGFRMENTPYRDMFVNAYLLWDAETREAMLVDTGADASALIAEANARALTISQIFLTHTHRDHIMDLDRVKEAFPKAIVYVGAKELFAGATPVEPGDRFQCGGLSVEARLTWGHAVGGITYVVQGLAKPLAIVGDAVFAGSMGGGMVSYADALRTNREAILSLPDETVLCPGHGPLTTVGEEKAHNPFF